MRIKIIIFTGILIIFFTGYSIAGDFLKIHFIDIGEGDAILIEAEGESALLDSGNLLSGYRLLDYLKKNGISKMKYLIITHPHPEHIGGVFFLLPKLKAENLFDNGQPLDKYNHLERWYEALFRSNKNYRKLSKSDTLKLGKTTLEVLWPVQLDPISYNDNSLVIKLKSKNFACLFTADISKGTELKLLDKNADLKANILKVAHHGSREATGIDFLDAVNPEVAVISAGKDDIKEVPASEVLDLLKTKGIKTYRTDKDGDILITASADGKYNIVTGKE
jgi:competence protein ComEC